ncbi:MAG: GAF domain-containing protein [Anaerolineae bacterium]|nr:GAF domain-containing protein [Anaerolineae bacterium]
MTREQRMSSWLSWRGTIRFRLLVAFLVTAILPVLIVASVAVIISWQSGQSYAVEQLSLSASFKQAQINDWVDGLKARLELDAQELDIATYARFIQAPASEDSGTVANLITELTNRVRQSLARTQLFDALFIVDPQGRVIFTTEPSEDERYPNDQLYRNRPFFQDGLLGQAVLIDGESVVAVQPLLDLQQQPIGVLVGRANLAELDAIVFSRAYLSENTESYLVSQDYVAFIGLGSSAQRIGVTTVGAQEALKGQDGRGFYTNYRGVPVIGVFRWLPELQGSLLVEVPRAEALRPVVTILLANIGVFLGVVVVAVAISVVVTRRIAGPIGSLAETAGRIADGETGLVAQVSGEDEIGTLARAFNRMTAQLRESVASLEQRVSDRTRDLEQRSVYLEASAEVGRATSSILDAGELVQQSVDLIRERFVLYYVGLFLVEGSGGAGDWAVLRAGTGETGASMVARGHRIRVGEGMVGWCIANNQARVALDVGKDAVRLASEELPDTRSEAALPLHSGGKVLGALTVQSDQPGAFDQDVLLVLQTMADQVATALDNARLFAQVQEALDSTQRAYGQMSHQAWTDLLRARQDLVFRSGERAMIGEQHLWRPEMEQAFQDRQTVRTSAVALDAGSPSPAGEEQAVEMGYPLAIPIRSGEDVIGVLDTFKPIEQGEWTTQEVAWLQDVTEQLSFALEAARFYQETQIREIRERQIREIGTNLQARVSLDALMQSAVADLARALNVPSAFVQLSTRSRSSDE